MSDLRIRCRQNGPLVIEGPFTLVDHLGNAFTLPTNKPTIALCRCGKSQRKPFCDGAHKECGFIAEELAAPLPPAGDSCC
jgi:CDGSH-type Zn-finger protein